MRKGRLDKTESASGHPLRVRRSHDKGIDIDVRAQIDASRRTYLCYVSYIRNGYHLLRSQDGFEDIDEAFNWGDKLVDYKNGYLFEEYIQRLLGEKIK